MTELVAVPCHACAFSCFSYPLRESRKKIRLVNPFRFRPLWTFTSVRHGTVSIFNMIAVFDVYIILSRLITPSLTWQVCFIFL